MTTEEELAEVQEVWEDALADLLEQWDQVKSDQQADLVAQVRDAVAAGTLVALASLTVDTGPAEDELTSAMEDLAETSAEQVAAEAAAQGVDVTPPAPDTVALGAVAAAMAGLLGAGFAVAAGTEALRLATPGRSAGDVAEGVDEHLESLGDGHLRTHLGGALSAAQAHGRLSTLAVAPVATWEASEVNDRNRCGPCTEEDGTVFDSLADAWLDYGTGVYVDCEGRWRCRGTIAATWD